MLFNFFKKFPFGLDISDYSIEALQLKKKFGGVYLKSYGRIKLEKGIVEDGKILNQEKLKEKLKELLKSTRPKRIKTKQVILSLPESKTFLHIFKIPVNLRGQELFEAVENEALKTIPLDPKDIYFDFRVISKTSTEPLQEVFYVAAPKEIVDKYLEMLEDLGLEPIALDIESASLTRAFKEEMLKDAGTLIIDIGARTTILTIFDRGKVRQSAILPIAGNHFTQAIAEKLNLSLEKAEELKKTCGIDPQKEGGRIMFILQGIMANIFSETKKFISFYETKSGRKIKKVLLCGGSSLLPKLLSDFSLNLGIEAKLADPFFGIKNRINKKLHPILFANVIGLAKRALEKEAGIAGINLIPLEKRIKPAFIGKKLNKSKIFKLFVVILMIATFAFFGWVVYSQLEKIVIGGII